MKEDTETEKVMRWYFEGNDRRMIPYSKLLHTQTENHYQDMMINSRQGFNRKNTFNTKLDNFSYEIEFNIEVENAGTQKNIETNKVRRIQRKLWEKEPQDSWDFDRNEKELKFKPLKDISPGYPDTWTDLDSLSFKTSIYNTVAIDLNSEEAKPIIDQCKDTLSGLQQIFQIERVQNLVAHHKYTKEKEIIQHKYDDGTEIEKRLFHGTKDTDPTLLLEAEEGFDMKYWRKGLWGRGVYFAQKLEYSHGYAHTLPSPNNNVKQVFLAKVLVGKAYECRNDSNIKMPPKDKKTNLKYDSIYGRTGSGAVHIVYENGRSYPEYLISYSGNSDEGMS